MGIVVMQPFYNGSVNLRPITTTEHAFGVYSIVL